MAVFAKKTAMVIGLMACLGALTVAMSNLRPHRIHSMIRATTPGT